MKHISAAVAIVAAAGVLCVNAAAYSTYCSNVTAFSAMTDYSGEYRQSCVDFEAAVNSDAAETIAGLYTQRLELFSDFAAEHSEEEYALALKLIDYDVMLNKLQLTYSRYSKLKTAAENYAAKYLVGECTKQEADSAEKQRSDKYYEIEGLLFDISSLKQEIESVTGETLTSDFDFSSVYLITDALKLSADEISCWGTAGSICTVENAEYKSKVSDITKQYSAAVKAYYSLGEELRKYVDSAKAYNAAVEEFRLGTLPDAQLETLCTAYEDAKLNAITAKAEYAKSLLELDKESGGALTRTGAVSSGLSQTLSSVLPESLRGSGLWLVRVNDDKVMFSPKILPISFDYKKDYGSYEVRYNGKTLYTAVMGQTAVFTSPEPVDGVNRCTVVFHKNGAVVGIYSVDIYSPFGEFLEG